MHSMYDIECHIPWNVEVRCLKKFYMHERVLNIYADF